MDKGKKGEATPGGFQNEHGMKVPAVIFLLSTMRVVRPLKLAVADRRILQELLEHGGEIDEAITPVLRRRIEIVVLAAQGWSNMNVAGKVGVEPSVVARWRKVFQRRYEIAPFPRSWSVYARVGAIRPYFADSPRSGRPKK